MLLNDIYYDILNSSSHLHHSITFTFLIVFSKLFFYFDILKCNFMLYPPKKRAYSPENKKTKDLSNLMNINSKFTGSGGSTS